MDTISLPGLNSAPEKISSGKSCPQHPSIPFFKQIPKCELHAHLNGSISSKTLLQLIDKKLQIDPSNQKYLELKSNQDWVCQPPTKKNFENLNTQHTTLDKCFKIFAAIHSIITNLDDLFYATMETVKEFYFDNVRYLELRTTPKAFTGKTLNDYVATVVEAIQLSCFEMNANQLDRSSPPLIVRLVLSINRKKHSVQDAWDVVKLALKWKQKTSNEDDEYFCPGGAVLGIDISGNPVNDASMKRFAPHIEFCHKNNLGTTIHFAETYNLEDSLAILNAKPTRLGHANYLDDILWKKLFESKIPVEICPTSNLLTASVFKLSDHNFGKMWEKRHPVSISTDDSGAFLTTLSRELSLIATAFQLTKQECLDLERKSLYQGFLWMINDDSKSLTCLKKIFTTKWESFYDEFGKSPDSL